MNPSTFVGPTKPMTRTVAPLKLAPSVPSKARWLNSSKDISCGPASGSSRANTPWPLFTLTADPVRPSE